MLPALGAHECRARGRLHVVSVADELRVGLVRGHGAAEHARLALVQAAHAVVGVHEYGGTGVNGGDALIVRGVGVTKRGHHALGSKARDVLGRLGVLGRQRALANEAARPALPLSKVIVRRWHQILGVLGTLVLLGKEGSLKVDARNASAHKVIVALVHRVCDGLALVANVLNRVRERGGQPRRGATLCERHRGVVDAGGVDVGGRMVVEAVDVGVNQAGANVGTRVVNDLAVRLLCREGPKATVGDGEVALSGEPTGENKVSGMNRIRCHDLSFQGQSPRCGDKLAKVYPRLSAPKQGYRLNG